MKIQITSRKFKARENLKEYIEQEIKTLEKINDDILDVDVILSFETVKDSIKIAEIIVQVPGKVVTSKEESDDFQKSVALAVSKIQKQLEKMKTKRIENKRTDKVQYEV
jgi:putative sigma-54 modulation protein